MVYQIVNKCTIQVWQRELVQ